MVNWATDPHGEIGKLILAACFIHDLGTVLALGVLFANSRPGWWCLS